MSQRQPFFHAKPTIAIAFFHRIRRNVQPAGALGRRARREFRRGARSGGGSFRVSADCYKSGRTKAFAVRSALAGAQTRISTVVRVGAIDGHHCACRARYVIRIETEATEEIAKAARLGTKSQRQKEAVHGLSKNRRKAMRFCSRAQPGTYDCLPERLV